MLYDEFSFVAPVLK